MTYAPAAGTGLRLDTESGTYPAGASPHVLSFPGGTLYYTLWEKTPRESDALATTPIAISAKTAGPTPVTLRLRTLSDAGVWSGEYRYFYFVGQGEPTAPAVAGATDTSSGSVHVQAVAPEDALLAVSLDGSAPDLRQPASPALLDLSAVTKSGSQAVVRAVAMDGAGALSPVAEVRLAAPGSSRPPGFTLTPGQEQGTAVLGPAPATASGTVVYELTSDGSDPSAPSVDSPVLAGPVVLSVPFGTTRTFKARVASLDASGRAGPPSVVASLELDRTPPEPPRLTPGPGILDEPTVVNLASTGRVFFSVTSDGSMPVDPGFASSPSNTFVALPGVEGASVTYRLKLAAVDPAGNATEVYGPLAYTVDLRPPVIPPVSGIVDGGHYAALEVSPVLEGDHAGSVHYSATSDGSEPPDPDVKSPELTGTTVFRGEVGAETQWRLKLLAVSHNGRRVGETRALTFFIDLQPPPVPRLSGLPAQPRVARPVTLTAEPMSGTAQVVFTLSDNGTEPPDPLAAGSPFPPSLTLDAPDGSRRDFVLRVAAVDRAGNKSLSDRHYRLTVDRDAPADPLVRGAEDGSVTAGTVTLSLEGSAALTVLELTDDGSIPRVPTASSRQYSGPVQLVGKDGASVTYRLIPRAFNDLGTASRAAKMFTVTVDRTVPAAPPAPSLQFSDANPGVAYLGWQRPEKGRILYRLESSAASSADYSPFDGPISVSVDPDHGSTIRGAAVFENAAGVRSAAAPFSLSVGKRLLPPVFRGARDNSPSTQGIQLACTVPDGEVRFETATDGGFPPTVTAGSARFPDALALDAADGQTVDVTVAARAFDPSGRSMPSDEVMFHAIVDRTPPDAPTASGIEDGGHYQDARTVTLLSAEGTIFDSVTTGPDAAAPAQVASNRYEGHPLVLDAPAGGSATYHITAFSVDAAGNRSREVRSWTVTIDKMIVYASPDGNDYSDGSRDAPVRSISRAVQVAQAGSRRTVYAAAGSYPEESEVKIAGDLTLVGGLDPGTWQPLGLERWSTVFPAEKWKGAGALLAMTSGTVSIRGFELAGSPTASVALVSFAGGSLSLSQGAVTLAGGGSGPAISQAGGALTLRDVRLRAADGWKGSFVTAGGGSLEIVGCQLTGPNGSPDFAALDLTDVQQAELKGSVVEPGSGQKTRGIRAVSSTLSIRASRVRSGTGTLEAIGLDSQESTITVEDTDLGAVAGARFPAGAVVSGGSLRIIGSRVAAAGAGSAVGLNVRGADVVVLRSTFRAGATAERAALVRLEDARALIANNLMVGAAAGESVGLQVRGGSTDVINNTIVGGSGASLTTAILVQGDALPRLVNNVISRTGPDLGSAILVLDARTLFSGSSMSGAVVLSNSLGGWKQAAHVEYGRGAKPLDLADSEALNRVDGLPYGGNVSNNLSEPAGKSFDVAAPDSYRLSRGSACLDAGVDLSAAQGPGATGAILLLNASEVSADILGNPRPGLLPLAVPGRPRGWDLGAYEYVE